MSALTLLGLGIGFIVAEIFFGSFFLFFIGLGLCITAGIEYIIGFGGSSVESVYICGRQQVFAPFPFSALLC